MGISIIGMLDEREEALRLLKSRIEARGHKTILIDISIGTGAIDVSLKADVTCDEIALAGNSTTEKIRALMAKERNKAVSVISDGLKNKLQEINNKGELQGVVAVAGLTGSLISLPSMRSLPFGIPKLLISSVAAVPNNAKVFSGFFGMRDITVMHSVVDTVGMNSFIQTLMINGAGTICGMVEENISIKDEGKPSIAITEFGLCDKAAHYIRDLLEDKYNIISFHAQGIGDKAALDFVSQGLFKSFIDLVPAGFSEYLLGGNRATGIDRFDPGCKSGRPYILSTCGFDLIGCGPIQRRDQGDLLWKSRRLAERKYTELDAIRVLARTNSEEIKMIAREMAGKLNGHSNKKLIKVVIPTKGFSLLSTKGMPLYDPDSDFAFIEELEKCLDKKIEILKVDNHVNTKEFAEATVDALKALL